MFPYQLEHVFSYHAQLQPPEIIGPVADGLRINFYVSGGEASGPRLSGRLRGAGGDWFTLRTDGVGVLSVRATLETADGALILIEYPGMGDAGDDGHARFLRGEMPLKLPLTTTPKLSCAHPDYAWVNRLIFLGVGEVDLQTLVVSYDVYAVQRP